MASNCVSCLAVRESVTEVTLTYQFTLIETKRETVELCYGEVVDPGRVDPDHPPKTGGRHAFVIDLTDGDDFIRAWLPSSEVTEVGEQVYANGQPVGYQVTLAAYPGPAWFLGEEVLLEPRRPAAGRRCLTASPDPGCGGKDAPPRLVARP